MGKRGRGKRKRKEYAESSLLERTVEFESHDQREEQPCSILGIMMCVNRTEVKGGC
jgi:hypothetical protein